MTAIESSMKEFDVPFEFPLSKQLGIQVDSFDWLVLWEILVYYSKDRSFVRAKSKIYSHIGNYGPSETIYDEIHCFFFKQPIENI